MKKNKSTFEVQYSAFLPNKIKITINYYDALQILSMIEQNKFESLIYLFQKFQLIDKTWGGLNNDYSHAASAINLNSNEVKNTIKNLTEGKSIVIFTNRKSKDFFIRRL